MKETNETTACRITITLDSAELPVDQQARNALLTEFRSRVGHLVEGLRGIDADQGDVDVSTGYRYAQVPATCPSVASDSISRVSIQIQRTEPWQARCVRAISVTGAVMQSIGLSTSRAAKATPSRAAYQPGISRRATTRTELRSARYQQRADNVADPTGYRSN